MQQQIDILSDVKSHFEHWRATRIRRGKIPDYLWDKVKLLIGRYSLTTITEALGINTSQMREHIDLGGKVNFVEVNTDTETKIQTQSNLDHHITAILDDNKTCSVELHRSTGGMLKICDYPIVSLPMIIAQFIG